MKRSGESAQINLRSQFLAVFIRHIFISGLAVVFGIGAFWWFLTQKTYNILYSCIFTCIYFGMMYSKCSRIAAHDLKGYAETKSYPLKGIVLVLPVILLTLALDILRLIMWKYMSDGTRLTGIPAVLSNAAFIMWTFPFNGIMAVHESAVSLAGRIALYGIPLISAFSGYFAGYKRFSLIEKLIPFMYEDKKK